MPVAQPRRANVGSFLVFLWGAWAIGCAPTLPSRAPLSQLAARASYDLRCAPEWLLLTNIDDRIKGVDGCGRRTTYVEICEPGAECIWWANPLSAPPMTELAPMTAPPMPRSEAPNVGAGSGATTPLMSGRPGALIDRQ